MINKGMFTSETAEWATPEDFFKVINNVCRFTLDVCANSTNAKCSKFFSIEENGLLQSWAGYTCWMNPPYGKVIGRWIKKAYDESKNADVVCLIPSRTDTAYWHDYVMKGRIIYMRGRLKFGDGKNPAPFPSALVIFGYNSAPMTIYHAIKEELNNNNFKCG